MATRKHDTGQVNRQDDGRRRNRQRPAEAHRRNPPGGQGRRLAQRPLENLADPHRLARLVRDGWGTDAEGRRTLRHWGRGWWHYADVRYELLDMDDLGSVVTDEVKREFDTRPVLDRHGRVRPVTNSLVGNVSNALRSLPEVRVAKETTQPAWLGPAPKEREYLAVKNGLLDMQAFLRREPIVLQPHTPEWFTFSCLPYDYEQTVTCPRWTGFLDWMFKGNREVIQFVQEWFGYCLVPGA